MAVTNGDFVAIEFVGRIADTGEVFDTNIGEVAKETKLEVKDPKPLVVAVGHAMLPKGLDADLEGKEVGTKYSVDLSAEDAFGPRDSKLVQMVPTKLFHAQKIDPVRGMQLSLDGRLVRVLSSDRGRTLVDFNGPLAGKKISYQYTILQSVSDLREQVNALQDFLFRRRFDFEVKDEKIQFMVEKEQEGFVQVFASKFKEILGKEIEAAISERGSDAASEKGS